MNWKLIFLFFFLNISLCDAQEGLLGLQLNVHGKAELVFDEPNLRGYVQDSVWLTEGSDVYVTDLTNMLYQYGTLSEMIEDVFFANNFDPSRKYEPQSTDLGITSNELSYVISDSLLHLVSISDMPSSSESVTHITPCGDWFMGYNISDSVLTIVHKELSEYCKTERLLDDDELERDSFRALLLKLSAMDENNYVLDNASFVLDRCRLHICEEGKLKELYSYAHDLGVSHYTIKYNELGDIVEFHEYVAGFSKQVYYLSYNQEGRVVRYLSKYRDMKDDNSETEWSAEFGYDSSGRLNSFEPSVGEMVQMSYTKP